MTPPLEFGQKIGLNLNEDLFVVFIILKFPAPPSPPFKKPAYATVWLELKLDKIRAYFGSGTCLVF